MKLINTLTGHTGCINALSSFNYFNSNYLISGSSDSKVKIWNNQISNQSLFELKTNHTDSIQALAYQNRLHYLAIGSKDKTFSLWKRRDVYEGKNLNTINTNDQVLIIAILPNSNIVSGSWDKTIKIWQSESPYQLITTLDGHTGSVKSLAILPNLNIVSSSSDETIKIWQ